MKNPQQKSGVAGHNHAELSHGEQAFRKLFEDGIRDIYWAEKALVKAIPKMIKKASSEDLTEALETHLSETKEHVSRLEKVFELISKKAQARKCAAMEGIIEEADQTISETEEIVRDAAIIYAAQKVEHYEISSYGSLCAFAHALGLEEAAGLLKETLYEEKAADKKLTEVAEASVNMEALSEE